MARSGPPKKPTARKILEGTFRKDRVNPREPKPIAGIPDCPAHVKGAARKEWDRIAPLLHQMRVLALTDSAVLAAYCVSVAMVATLSRAVDREGLTMVTDKGFIMARPEVQLLGKQTELLRKLASELGLTPASRASVQTLGNNPQEDEAADFLFGGMKKTMPNVPRHPRTDSAS